MATDVEIAWAAGFYEGEGHFGVRRNPYGHPTALRCGVGQRNLEPLERFHAAVDLIGKIRRRDLGRKHGGDIWYYDAGKTDNSLYVARLMFSHLSEKRRQQIVTSVDEFLSVRHIKEFDVTFVTDWISVKGV